MQAYVGTQVVYKTFIPNAYIANPFPDGAGTYFKGDNRGFSSTSEQYRTKAHVQLSWDTAGKPTTTLSKKIGTTHLTDSNYNVIWSGTASSAGITKTDHSDTTVNKAHFTIYHDVGIPYRDNLSPDITYTYTATVYGDGSYEIYVGHDRAPSHELYINNNGTWKTVHTHSNEGFDYLSPAYGGQHSGVYSGY